VKLIGVYLIAFLSIPMATDVVADFDSGDEIGIGVHRENVKIADRDNEKRPVRSVDVPVDPCLDLGSVEFALGDCLGAAACRGSTPVDVTQLTDLELQNLRSNTSRFGDVGRVDVNYCGSNAPDGGSGTPSLSQLVERQWEQTRLPSPVIRLEPRDALTLVNLDTYAQAEQEPFTESLTLLGQEVFLRADPVMWHWDYGDGSPVVSEDHPGTYYPDPTGAYAYLQPGSFMITLVIDWRGQYSTNNRDWHPIYGTGRTTSTAEIEVIEHRPRLEALKTN